MRYLLDTNVLSEIRKPNGNARVKAFVNSLREEDLFFSALSIGEIRFGIEKLPPGPKKTELLVWLTQKLPEWFENRIISLDADTMAEWGRLQAETAKTLPLFDSLIAATALVLHLTLVSRNTRDFERVPGIILLNPWEEA